MLTAAEDAAADSLQLIVLYTKKAFAVQRARDIVRITFGAQQINDLLGGGLESKAITEMFGEYRWDLSLPAYMLLLLAMIR
jgi:RecA/RadA recombinase